MISIAASVIERVIAEARASRPRECCGVLLGRGHDITEAFSAPNLADGASRFLLDPKAHIAARRKARSEGLEVVGFYHSHPRSAANPSATDLAEAAYPECMHLIVGFVDGQPEVRLFSYTDGEASELKTAVVHS